MRIEPITNIHVDYTAHAFKPEISLLVCPCIQLNLFGLRSVDDELEFENTRLVVVLAIIDIELWSFDFSHVDEVKGFWFRIFRWFIYVLEFDLSVIEIDFYLSLSVLFLREKLTHIAPTLFYKQSFNAVKACL